jgi:hypothetical protein
MSVAQFVQTNFAGQDSTTYKTSIDADIQVLHQMGGMFAPHQSSPAAMTITVDAGTLFVNNAIVSQSAQVSGTITAPVTFPRIDRAVIDAATGALSVITGAESGSPVAPAISAGKLPCAQIALSVGQASIVNTNITDERLAFPAINMAQYPFGQCYLSLSGGNLLLSPWNGNLLAINGILYTIPSGGVTLAPTSLSANTTYYIYAWMNSGTMTLEASATAYATNTTTGIKQKSGDATRTLVGMWRIIAGPAWSTSPTLGLSWFNRQSKSANAYFTTTRGITSTIFVEIHSEIEVPFLSWLNANVNVASSGMFWTSNGTYAVVTSIGFDGTTPQEVSAASYLVNEIPFALNLNTASLSEGYHYATLLGLCNGGGVNAAWYNVANSAGQRTTLYVTVEG